MHVLALGLDLRIPGCRSLKDKRAALRPILDGARHRHRVAVAEVDHLDEHQRAGIGVAAVSASPAHATEIIDAVERFVWSFPEIEVVEGWRRWLEDDR